MRPTEDDRLATDDHSDLAWGARALDELTSFSAELADFVRGMADPLTRFDGYGERFAAALTRIRAGEGQWVAGVNVPRCQAVWMKFREDLLSTLGIARGAGQEGR
ncbi:hypothetical protein [Streptomyces sp. NPDC058011]|uniref:hypothetical protein n=1 Tax=Streptomyces sp. NPDC058011 TaxID=3346305 RepID=UPI0036EFCAAA